METSVNSLHLPMITATMITEPKICATTIPCPMRLDTRKPDMSEFASIITDSELLSFSTMRLPDIIANCCRADTSPPTVVKVKSDRNETRISPPALPPCV
jgi:hypothetical protein